MPEFTESLKNWKSGAFPRVLKNEIERLAPGSLPLHEGTSQGGYVDDSEIAVTIINCVDRECCIEAKVGIFFNEVVGGCSCGDEPSAGSAYCEVQVSIDKTTADVTFTVVED